jgi:hypothetical protein
VLCGQPRSTTAAQDELRMDYEDKKEELFDLCLEMRRTRAFKTMSWEDVQNLRLTTHLAAQVKPKPDDAIWYNLKHMKLYCSICFPSFIFFLYHLQAQISTI